MAATTDPRGASFDGATFRDAIRFAMNMGLPNNVSERATFMWESVSTYDIADPVGNPYDYNAVPTHTTHHADTQVPVAVQFIQRGGQGEVSTPFGEIDATHVILTVLDEDYQLIYTAQKVKLGGDVYKINFVAPPEGLFDVTVYNVYATAEDES